MVKCLRSMGSPQRNVEQEAILSGYGVKGYPGQQFRSSKIRLIVSPIDWL